MLKYYFSRNISVSVKDISFTLLLLNKLEPVKQQQIPPEKGLQDRCSWPFFGRKEKRQEKTDSSATAFLPPLHLEKLTP